MKHTNMTKVTVNKTEKQKHSKIKHTKKNLKTNEQTQETTYRNKRNDNNNNNNKCPLDKGITRQFASKVIRETCGLKGDGKMRM